jgi:hypothetical protein
MRRSRYNCCHPVGGRRRTIEAWSDKPAIVDQSNDITGIKFLPQQQVTALIWHGLVKFRRIEHEPDLAYPTS